MAKTVCKLLGVVFVLVGICGFFAHNLLGAHLNTPHNVVHIVSGILALYFGFAGSLSGAKGFCIVFGIVYGLLGVVGFVKGTLDIPALKLMLGQVDHVIHVVLGIGFLAGGLLTKK